MISTLIITYNQENYIQECIKGLLSQTIDDQEILISDDCSTDNTFEIIKQYELSLINKFKKVHIIKQPNNLGLAGRNNIKYLSTQISPESRYIQIIEGDDWYKPQKSEVHLNFLENNPDFIAIHSDIDRYLENGAIDYNFWKLNKKTVQQPSGEIYNTLIQGNRIMQCSSMIRTKEYLESFNYDLFIKHGIILGDYAGWLRLSQKGKIKYLDESLACYRHHAKGTSNNPDTRQKIIEDTHKIQRLSIEGVI